MADSFSADRGFDPIALFIRLRGHAAEPYVQRPLQPPVDPWALTADTVAVPVLVVAGCGRCGR